MQCVHLPKSSFGDLLIECRQSCLNGSQLKLLCIYLQANFGNTVQLTCALLIQLGWDSVASNVLGIPLWLHLGWSGQKAEGCWVQPHSPGHFGSVAPA